MNNINRLSQITSILNSKPKYEKMFWYKGKAKPFGVYEVSLDLLVYNPYNGRILSFIQTAENSMKMSSNYNNNISKDNLISDIDIIMRERVYDDVFQKQIENYLWESSKSQNESTYDSLVKFHQSEVGIITKDGVIIDGNRRVMILRKINKDLKVNRKFLTIILEDKLEDNRKEILTLETIYQQGIDAKVNYSPIEKYLKVKELLEFNYSYEDISELMAEKIDTIIKWKGILDLMIDYLNYLGYNGIYSILEKREGQFVDLYTYLNTYRNNLDDPLQITDWIYNEDNLTNLKEVYFDYIRMGIPVNACRVIGRTRNRNSIFCHSELWKLFLNTLERIKIKEISIQEYHQKMGGIDYYNSVTKREMEHLGKYHNIFINNLHTVSRNLDDLMSIETPLKLLDNILYSLKKINLENIPNKAYKQFAEKLNEIQNIIINFGIK